MKTVQLTKNQIALVDDEDFDRVTQFKWSAVFSKTTNTYYVIANIWYRKTKKVLNKHTGCYYTIKLSPDNIYKEATTISLHRFIMGLDSGDKREVDHINHNTLDNRKENLRIVTHRQNAYNQKNQSKYGYCIRYLPKNSLHPFEVRVSVNRKAIIVGYYKTHQEAIDVRNNWIKDNL